MHYKIVTPPAAEPISTAELKAHLRVDTSDEDTPIAGYLAAAREYVENATQRQLVTATLRATLDYFPSSWRAWDSWSPARGRIELRRLPVQSVTSVIYTDTAGTATTIAGAGYVLNAPSQDAPAWIEPAYNDWWPTAREVSGAVTVDFVAGYGLAAAVPRIYKQAILLLAAHWYENREAVVVGTIAPSLPMGLENLINQGRWEVH